MNIITVITIFAIFVILMVISSCLSQISFNDVLRYVSNDSPTPFKKNSCCLVLGLF